MPLFCQKGWAHRLEISVSKGAFADLLEADLRQLEFGDDSLAGTRLPSSLFYSLAGLGLLKQNPLWVGSDCEDCDFLLVRPVEPKNTVRRWRSILGIRLEDFFAVGAGK